MGPEDGPLYCPPLTRRAYSPWRAERPSLPITRDQTVPDIHPMAAPPSLDHLLPDVYRELCAVAHRQLATAPPGGSLVTSELVHEVYLRLAARPDAPHDRGHFFALASVAMRHILVDRAKARTAIKRGGPHRPITLDEDMIAVADQADALLELDAAISALAETAPRLAEVVQLRFFGGMSEAEIAGALGLTERTVQRDWAKARMLLHQTLAS